MDEIERIGKQHDLVLHGDAWHGDPVWTILDGISATQAALHPIASAHSIWELVLHMIFWEKTAAQRLSGQPVEVTEELNFPSLPEATESNWQQTLQALRASNQQFSKAVARLSPSRLEEKRPDGKRTLYEEAHGLIQHSVYHAGQIALLRKASG